MACLLSVRAMGTAKERVTGLESEAHGDDGDEQKRFIYRQQLRIQMKRSWWEQVE